MVRESEYYYYYITSSATHYMFIWNVSSKYCCFMLIYITSHCGKGLLEDNTSRIDVMRATEFLVN